MANITVGPNTNAQAFAFFEAIGRPELKADPRFFDSAPSRTANAAAYFEVRAAALKKDGLRARGMFTHLRSSEDFKSVGGQGRARASRLATHRINLNSSCECLFPTDC